MINLPETLQWQLFKAVKRIKADLDFQLNEICPGVTSLQFFVLKHLAQETATINDLAQTLSIKPPSLVPVVVQLQRDLLVQKKTDPKDRRKIYLSLSPKGKKMMSKISYQGDSKALDNAIKKLGPKKTQSLNTLLKELTGLMPNK